MVSRETCNRNCNCLYIALQRQLFVSLCFAADGDNYGNDYVTNSFSLSEKIRTQRSIILSITPRQLNMYEYSYEL